MSSGMRGFGPARKRPSSWLALPRPQGSRILSSCAFGILALTLAAGGLYGTLLYTVNQRSQEMGIRLALGARSAQIQQLVVRQGIVLAVFGAALGLLGTWYLSQFLERWLYGVGTADAVSLTSAVVLLLSITVAASWFPAFRAGRTDPMTTLGSD